MWKVVRINLFYGVFVFVARAATCLRDRCSGRDIDIHNISGWRARFEAKYRNVFITDEQNIK